MQTAKSIVLSWGHSYEDYLAMFDLDANCLNRSIFDCGAGPASFNAEMTAAGKKVVSCDAIYAIPKPQLQMRIETELARLFDSVSQHPEHYSLSNSTIIEQFKQQRRSAIEKFLADFNLGLQEQRYQAQNLPQLNFSNYQFDLALCSHHLFQAPDQSFDFSFAAILELCRVAHEARIFPLVNHEGQILNYLGPLIAALQAKNFGVEIRQVSYTFQKQGNAMLRIWAQGCHL